MGSRFESETGYVNDIIDNFKICVSCQLYNHWHLADGHCEDPRCECEYRRGENTETPDSEGTALLRFNAC